MKKLVKNKKGAEMTIGTIIVIVLALVVLVVLIVGFTQGWGTLWTWFTNLFGGASPIDAVVNGCNTACATKAMNAYCTQVRTVKAETAVFIVDKDKLTLAQTGESTIESKEAKGSCKEFAAGYSTLGFPTCPDLTCPA